MAYLLAKYTLLFLLASVLGFALGYWWSRRRMVDVTDSFESLKSARARSDRDDWNQLFGRLDALPKPKETDLTGLTKEIQALQATVTGIPKPKETDLSGVTAKLAELQKAIATIPTPSDPDLSLIDSKLGALDKTVAAIPRPEKPRDIDLAPIEKELARLQVAVREMPTVETHEAADLSPIEARFASLERQIRELPQPEPVSFASINSRLDKIDAKLKKQRKAKPSISLPQPAKEGEPVILSAALYGDADDLKRISGVGPKLEKLLHKNGVYYFWQVASWHAKDIQFIDNRLEVFKGRIARDSWVSQAQGLKRGPGAASMPG